jgi:hypothetical protein
MEEKNNNNILTHLVSVHLIMTSGSDAFYDNTFYAFRVKKILVTAAGDQD